MDANHPEKQRLQHKKAAVGAIIDSVRRYDGTPAPSSAPGGFAGDGSAFADGLSRPHLQGLRRTRLSLGSWTLHAGSQALFETKDATKNTLVGGGTLARGVVEVDHFMIMKNTTNFTRIRQHVNSCFNHRILFRRKK